MAKFYIAVWCIIFFGGWAFVFAGYAFTYFEFPPLNPEEWQKESRLFLYAWATAASIIVIAAANHD